MNCAQPRLIDTARVRRLYPGEERTKFASREISLRDFGQPQDMANAITFLASPRARSSPARSCSSTAACPDTRSEGSFLPSEGRVSEEEARAAFGASLPV